MPTFSFAKRVWHYVLVKYVCVLAVSVLIWIAWQWHIYDEYGHGVERSIGVWIGDHPADVLHNRGKPSSIDDDGSLLNDNNEVFDLDHYFYCLKATSNCSKRYRHWTYSGLQYYFTFDNRTDRIIEIECNSNSLDAKYGYRDCSNTYSFKKFRYYESFEPILGVADRIIKLWCPIGATCSKDYVYDSMGLRITSLLKSNGSGGPDEFTVLKTPNKFGFVHYLSGKLAYYRSLIPL